MQNIATDERPIVVGVDGSAGAQQALHWASGEALVRGVPLEVVHAWEPPYSISGVGSILSPREIAPYRDHARKVLDQTIHEEFGAVDPSPAIIPELRQGYPPAKLLEATHDAQLLVVGSRGVGALKGALLGSVSHHCTMHSTVPVAVVRENAGWSRTDEIVVGIDGSDEAAAALRWAIREAVVRNSKLVVIHAWHFDAKTAPAEHRYAAANKRTVTERSEALVEQEVENAIAAVGAAPDPVVLVSSCQAPVRALVDRAGATGLLVMGSRGRGGFAASVLGSVSQHCLHQARGVVVVVPQGAADRVLTDPALTGSARLAG
jgi:nucleotide-binding universal stress UspA family protein